MDIQDAQSSVTDVIRSQQNNPVEDARLERARATFDVAKLSVYINESQENIDRRFNLVPLVCYHLFEVFCVSLSC